MHRTLLGLPTPPGDFRPPVLGSRSMHTPIMAWSFDPTNPYYLPPTEASAPIPSPGALIHMVRSAAYGTRLTPYLLGAYFEPTGGQDVRAEIASRVAALVRRLGHDLAASARAALVACLVARAASRVRERFGANATGDAARAAVPKIVQEVIRECGTEEALAIARKHASAATRAVAQVASSR